jgi:hypothetical protein
MLRAAEGRSFFFIDIRASFLHFLKLLVPSFPVGGDILSSAAMPAKSSLHPACLKYSRQPAVSRRQKAGVAQVPLSGPAALQTQPAVSRRQFAGPRRKRAIHYSPFTIQHFSSTTPPTTLAYSPPFVKRHGVRFRQASRREREPRIHHAAELHGRVALLSVTSMHSSATVSF